jgi:hypothetical protein
MKKFFTIMIICLLVAGTALSQTGPKNKGIQKITAGFVFASSGAIRFPILDKAKPIALGYNLSPNLCFLTNKSYHNILYGFANNAIRMVNGYKIQNDLGIYFIAQKNLSTRNGGYASIGIEKFIKTGDATFFLFTELGRNIHPTYSLITLGFHANIQMAVWKRK